MENSKEINKIMSALSDYMDKHEGQVQMNINIEAWDEEKQDLVDGFMFNYGVKEPLIDILKWNIKELEKDKRDFIGFDDNEN